MNETANKYCTNIHTYIRMLAGGEKEYLPMICEREKGHKGMHERTDGEAKYSWV